MAALLFAPRFLVESLPLHTAVVSQVALAMDGSFRQSVRPLMTSSSCRYGCFPWSALLTCWSGHAPVPGTWMGCLGCWWWFLLLGWSLSSLYGGRDHWPQHSFACSFILVLLLRPLSRSIPGFPGRICSVACFWLPQRWFPGADGVGRRSAAPWPVLARTFPEMPTQLYTSSYSVILYIKLFGHFI